VCLVLLGSEDNASAVPSLPKFVKSYTPQAFSPKENIVPTPHNDAPLVALRHANI